MAAADRDRQERLATDRRGAVPAQQRRTRRANAFADGRIGARLAADFAVVFRCAKAAHRRDRHHGLEGLSTAKQRAKMVTCV